MRVVTPYISWHNRERISSLDFQWKSHPTDKIRFASCGDDKNVVIWQLSEKDDKSYVSCLADLSRHQNSVNAVRWSKDGKFLASGDTDSTIYLWHYRDTPCIPDIFNEDDCAKIDANEDTENIQRESWTVLKILRGHLQDVVSLSWSSCNKYLISSSTDNTAIVWDVQKGSKLKILSDHQGWVNGVSFDPLGKFVATICGDRILRLYHCKTWKTAFKTYKCKFPRSVVQSDSNGNNEELNVRLFHDDTFQSFYRRMDFSPDGKLLIVPSGVLDIENETKLSHCAYIFTRYNFSKPAVFLPNPEFTIAVRFSPVLFTLRHSNMEEIKVLFDLPYRLIYAVASQNAVNFYDTQQSVPFARVSNIHYIGLTDLAWSPDGHTCIVSSSDGFASIIKFDEGELGDIYNFDKEENNVKELKNETLTINENEGDDNMEEDLHLVLEESCSEKPENDESLASLPKQRRVELITLSK